MAVNKLTFKLVSGRPETGVFSPYCDSMREHEDWQVDAVNQAKADGVLTVLPKEYTVSSYAELFDQLKADYNKLSVSGLFCRAFDLAYDKYSDANSYHAESFSSFTDQVVRTIVREISTYLFVSVNDEVLGTDVPTAMLFKEMEKYKLERVWCTCATGRTYRTAGHATQLTADPAIKDHEAASIEPRRNSGLMYFKNGYVFSKYEELSNLFSRQYGLMRFAPKEASQVYDKTRRKAELKEKKGQPDFVAVRTLANYLDSYVRDNPWLRLAYDSHRYSMNTESRSTEHYIMQVMRLRRSVLGINNDKATYRYTANELKTEDCLEQLTLHYCEDHGGFVFVLSPFVSAAVQIRLAGLNENDYHKLLLSLFLEQEMAWISCNRKSKCDWKLFKQTADTLHETHDEALEKARQLLTAEFVEQCANMLTYNL